jgi:hypothetical protein
VRHMRTRRTRRRMPPRTNEPDRRVAKTPHRSGLGEYLTIACEVNGASPRTSVACSSGQGTHLGGGSGARSSRRDGVVAGRGRRPGAFIRTHRGGVDRRALRAPHTRRPRVPYSPVPRFVSGRAYPSDSPLADRRKLVLRPE